MSKNVAVFVDVANIFYAAKAAGVDIDYVTLLKAAVAGRDFVRAYAYTGLDPENENQRQFHAFLARNGYRVVSKDIRKYGDGKVKANLDIELVVDMMRTARNLDVAVVVSGDGDFAPAIRAVQDMGVRCEVISFRGNTSSDLIDVADVFTDITQIARVERGSSRSGRRVAAEEDLSMTEVPDKETEGAVRHRRGRRGEGRDGRDGREGREARDRRDLRDGRRAAPPREGAAVGAQSLLVLPGEKLRRAGEPAPVPVEAVEAPGEDEEEIATGEIASEAQGDGGQRRRRRRGGRGRGRGRGVETPQEVGGEEPLEELEDLELEVPRVPQHSTFGSVWDSQLGMPTAPITPPGEAIDELLDEEEPEIPEYLLAERRQRGGRGRGGRGRGGGRNAAYQQAIERERFGRAAPGAPSLGGPRIQRDRQGGGRGPRQPSFERPERAERPRPQREPQPERRAPASDEPWSEVPPEIEELLRAELAKRGSGQQPPQAPVRETSAPREAPARGRGRGRGAAAPAAEARAEAAAAAAPGEHAAALAADATRLAAEAAAEPAADTAPARTGRGRGGRRTAAPSAPPEAVDVAPSVSTSEGAAEAAAAPAAAGRRRGRAATAPESPVQAAASTPAPARRRRTSAAPAAAESSAAPAAEPDAAAPARRRRTTAKPAEGAPGGDAAAGPSTDAAATTRRRTVRRTKAAGDGGEGAGSGSTSDAG